MSAGSFGPLQFNPLDLATEAWEFQKHLAEGTRVLGQVEDVEYGATAREEVWRDGKTVLYRFVGDRPAKGPPLLIVYALVNRPYMVDLQADRSLVKGLLALGLDDYINRYIDGAVDHLAATHGGPVNLLGVCQGGAFSLCYAALHPEKVRNLVTMVTPVDFQTPDNMLSSWVRELDVDLFVDALGNVPADLMNASYLMLKPFRLNLQKYVGLVDTLDNPKAVEDFLRMEKWIFDSPDQAGEAFRDFIKQFYQGNAFVNGTAQVGGQKVDLGFVGMPVLNIYAEQDHLVPPDASRALAGLVGSEDYTELGFKGGHIGIYVSSRAQREVPAAIHRWLSTRGGT